MLRMVVTEQDFDPAIRARAKALKEGHEVLGPEENELETFLTSVLPAALIEKVRKVLPSEFQLKELEFKVEVKGMPFGIGLGGEIGVKIGPASK